jgi:hypothetical protein
MDDVERLVGAARRSVVQLVARARKQISIGANPDRIQSRYVSRALARLEDAEAYAVLAAAGDKNALTAIKEIVAELETLHQNLQGELSDQEDGDGDR